jgi:hypothetical protein
VFALGLAVRALLYWWRVGPALSKRLELVVPASMFERAVEGAFLAEWCVTRVARSCTIRYAALLV